MLLLTFSDYRETAAKFQKEWHVKEPHRDLEFAPHVEGHALVSVVNRGLLYQALEREHTRKQVRSDAQGPSLISASFQNSL